MKYLGIICLVIIVSLGIMGVGYANLQQDLAVSGKVTTGTWNAANFTSFDFSNASGSSLESAGERTFTFMYHSKDNNRHNYNGSILCPITNNGNVPVTIDTVQITITGPDRDPTAANLFATPQGALMEANNTRIDPGNTVFAGLNLSGNPYKGDYYVMVSFITRVFTE